VISVIIDIVTTMAKAVGWAEQFDEKQRVKLADQFDRISTVLEEFREKRLLGQPAPGLCARLNEHAMKLREVASGTLPSPDIDRLVVELAGACEALQNLSTADKGAPDHAAYNEYLDRLADGAGAFRGCADVLRTR
jgi:hypothetical protein